MWSNQDNEPKSVTSKPYGEFVFLPRYINPNQDLSTWNVSSVSGMGSMFQDVSSFNQGLSMWDVASVTSMYNMFAGASSFNQDLSTWNASSVTSMQSMFAEASTFNQDISVWDISRVYSMEKCSREHLHLIKTKISTQVVARTNMFTHTTCPAAASLVHLVSFLFLATTTNNSFQSL